MRRLFIALGVRSSGSLLSQTQKLSCLAMVIGLLATASVNAQILDLNPASEELPTPTASDSFFEREGLTPPELKPVVQETVVVQEPVVQKPVDATPAEKPIEAETVLEEPPAIPQREQDERPLREAANTETMAVREVRGEPIARGPIHEAFAEPLRLTPEPTEVRKVAPPASVEEIPPEATDATKKLQWIPGYWAWDKQRDDYIWVSGVWRKAPKSRVWLPGRWEELDGGHQWVPGAWMKANAEGELFAEEALPKAPPKSLEEGPTSPTPSDNHFWVPGVWKQNEQRSYAWRPGFWSESQKNWVWVPDHYSWAPGGCSFVPGYWDYTWERRGTLYAPCTFAAQDLTGRVSYTPTKIVDTNQWLVNLWVGPSRSHYYYGDYYDYAQLGYSPWYSYYGSNRNFYDPFYTYYRQRFPATYGIGLYGYLDGLHSYYRLNASRRPSVAFYGRNHSYGNRLGYSPMYGNVQDLYRHLGRGSFDSRYGDRYRSGYGYGFDRDPYRARSTTTPSRAYSTRPYPSGSYRDNRTGGSGRNGGSGRGGSRSNSQVDRGVRDVVNSQRQPKPKTTAKPLDRGTTNRGPFTVKEGGRGPFSEKSRGPFTQKSSSQSNRSTRPSSKPVERSNSPNRQRQNVRTFSSPSRTNTSRPNVSRPQTRPQQVQTRPQTRPQSRPESRPQARPQTTRPKQTTRPNVTSRPSQPSRSVTRPTPQVSRPAPKVNRVTPKVKRSAPTRPSTPSKSPGFTTSGMRRARGADLQKQRAAMQKLMQQRKGKKN